ncbi:MAG TPA: HAMP domain-containing histidine kinase [Epsilonproteobacteria bacterium]|nr:HAMP domain-containing histidine kinase [Campylobacterota bacterium]HHD72374.1 HAMP domain-containing histidine kinase [Campylobacterota bacterium]
MSKERVIVLTSYERRALYRFLALYLGSVFILLAIIGYLFFENNVAMMMSSTKYEMMYQARKISSKIVMTAMGGERVDKKRYLNDLDHQRFKVGYYDKRRQKISGTTENFENFDQSFSSDKKSCYAVLEDPSEHLGVRYIVLKESNLSREIHAMRMKIVGYLILSFIFMGVIGYFLARLFLAPVRQKIESLDRFISDTTHELNTPVSAILMTIQTLKGCDPRKLKRLEASAKRLSTMYGSLTYRLEERGREQQVERLSLTELIEERVQYAKALIESKGLRVDLDLDVLYGRMDRESALRLIDNLLSNAIKYSDPDGSIRIVAKKSRLIVEDEGVGIDEAAQKDIFKRYKRANKERGGFGIGLDIVLSICKRYGIKIKSESQKGKGSRFILMFPNGT